MQKASMLVGTLQLCKGVLSSNFETAYTRHLERHGAQNCSEVYRGVR